MQDILDQLGLEATNPGTWFGSESSEDTNAVSYTHLRAHET